MPLTHIHDETYFEEQDKQFTKNDLNNFQQALIEILENTSEY